MVKEAARKTLQQAGGVPRGAVLGVAVSGGADSMVLLHVLRELAREQGFSLLALHFEHGIRGAESLRDRAFVEKACAALGVRCRTESADVPAAARGGEGNIEAAARRLRYGFFARARAEEGLFMVAVAHHRGDAAESVLLHLLRGSGMAGLLPMAALREDGIVRPLLHVGREEILAYARAHGVAYVEDSTNADETYARNYLRREILPRLRRLNPRAEEAILRAAELLAEEDEALAALTEKIEGELAEIEGEKTRLDRAALLLQPVAVQRRLVRRAIGRAGSLTDVDRAMIDRVLALAAGESGREFAPGDKFFAGTAHNTLIIGQKMYKIDKNGSFALAARGETPLWPGERMVVAPAPLPAVFPPQNSLRQIADEQALAGAVVRTRLPGDRFTPLGMKGGKPLADWMIDKKIAGEERGALPLVVRGNEVLWVVGHALSEKLRARAGRPAVEIVYKQDGEEPK